MLTKGFAYFSFSLGLLLVAQLIPGLGLILTIPFLLAMEIISGTRYVAGYILAYLALNPSMLILNYNLIYAIGPFNELVSLAVTLLVIPLTIGLYVVWLKVVKKHPMLKKLKYMVWICKRLRAV